MIVLMETGKNKKLYPRERCGLVSLVVVDGGVLRQLLLLPWKLCTVSVWYPSLHPEFSNRCCVVVRGRGLVVLKGRGVSSRPPGSPPPCRWAWAGWCARTERCSSPWCHRAGGRGPRCRGRTGSSGPSGTCSRLGGPASAGRTPTCRSSRWSRSAGASLAAAWRRKGVSELLLTNTLPVQAS